jgi:hypothetical protein
MHAPQTRNKHTVTLSCHVLLHVQDMFDAGLVLGDTDYRQLSYKERGQLPGTYSIPQAS